MIHPLTKAFEALRSKGYYAERAAACCSSCALAQIPKKYARKYVFTHAQDEQCLEAESECYVAWAAPRNDPKDIIKALKDAGLKVIHDGDVNVRIKIIC